MTSRSTADQTISIIIPAHNESEVIGRLLSGLLADAAPGEFEVIVVANGCSDSTADVAKAHGVHVISSETASKTHAMGLGDAHAQTFPRLYVDADVELTTDDARALAAALRSPRGGAAGRGKAGILAAAPERVLALDGRPLIVRWYYQVWQRLPAVQDGLFGRGVIAVNRRGRQRLAAAPVAMSDDLAASVSFAPHERRVVAGSQVIVHTPRSSADLIRRRVRALTGTAQLRQLPGVDDARTSKAQLLRVVRTEPAMAPRMVVFLAVTVVARLKARRPIRSQDFTTWLRDDSSRGVTATLPTRGRR